MLLKSTGTGTSLSISNLSTLFFKLLKLLDTFFNLSIFTLSTSDFKLVKSVFQAKSDVQQLLGFLNLLLLHNKVNPIVLSLFLRKILVLENIRSFMSCLFYQSKYKSTILAFPFNI